MSKKKQPYQEAADELERLVQSLEQGKLNIDELSDKVKRATELLHYCKEQLHTIEEEINNIMNEE